MDGDIFGIKDVAHVHIFDFSTKKPIATIEYGQAAQEQVAGERTYITGGYGNVRWLSFDTQKTATYQLTSPMVDLKMIALVNGTEIEHSPYDLYQKDTVTVIGGKATLKYEPKEILGVNYANGSANDIGQEIAVVDGDPTDNDSVSLDGKNLTFSGNIADETLVNVFYSFTTDDTARTIATVTNAFPKYVTVVADGIWKNLNDGVYDAVKIQIYKAQPQVAYTLAQSNGNDATTLEINFDMFSHTIATPDGKNHRVYMTHTFLGEADYDGNPEDPVNQETTTTSTTAAPTTSTTTVSP